MQLVGRTINVILYYDAKACTEMLVCLHSLSAAQRGVVVSLELFPLDGVLGDASAFSPCVALAGWGGLGQHVVALVHVLCFSTPHVHCLRLL